MIDIGMNFFVDDLTLITRQWLEVPSEFSRVMLTSLEPGWRMFFESCAKII